MLLTAQRGERRYTPRMGRAALLEIRRWLKPKRVLPPAARLPRWVGYAMVAYGLCALQLVLMTGHLWEFVHARAWVMNLLTVTFPPRAMMIATSIIFATLPVGWVAMMLLGVWSAGRMWRVRRAYRAAGGVLCTACLHPMAGLEQQPRCPECGHPFDLVADAAMWRALQFPTWADVKEALTPRW